MSAVKMYEHNRQDVAASMRTRARTHANISPQGWQRSYHQRKFHDNFIRACARIFFKTEPDGTFQRAHQAILDVNGWETLSQEILISTPRRFGKTISVSMFAAAMIFSAPRLELAIYSTCKRISQKLLQNVRKFLNLITTGMKRDPMRLIRSNMEEMVLQGPDGVHDVRTVCSYPSKVSRAHTHTHTNTHFIHPISHLSRRRRPLARPGPCGLAASGAT